MKINAQIMALFGAFHVSSEIAESEDHASLVDVLALASDYRYAMEPNLVREIGKLTPGQRGILFKEMGAALEENVEGVARNTSPLYRKFPNHEILPLQLRVVYFLLHFAGIEVKHDPELYGADPVTGFQDETFGASKEADEKFSIPLEIAGGNDRREFRILKLADDQFIAEKVSAMMSNATPFSSQEADFVDWAIKAGRFDMSQLASVKFREKLPLVFDRVSVEEYAKACNSVTDVLRLAALMSGPQVIKGSYSWSSTTVDPDLSLSRAPKFALKTSQAKALLALVEAIVARGTTDHETDFLRHEEPWKRFAAHVRSRRYEKRFPMAVKALEDMRSGALRSWEQKYERSDALGRIEMAAARPGVFMRRMTALGRQVAALDDGGAGKARLAEAAVASFADAEPLKLIQLLVHLERTNKRAKRYHMLPKGTIMASEAEPIDMGYVSKPLREHLSERLKGTLPYKGSEELKGMFVPAGNRAASAADVRTSKGDRRKLAFEDSDTIRLFLHWHAACDVDLSASLYNVDMEHLGDCNYHRLEARGVKHSGDILDGRKGAAEYIEIPVAKAKKAGLRYVLMTANVFSGETFDKFPCSVGAMIRDGQTGRHFEVSTVESKLSLDSPTRRTNPSIFDLETGEMIYVDLHGNWRQGDNVRSQAADLAGVLDYYLNFAEYRASFADVLEFAGTPDAEELNAEGARAIQDEILSKMATV